MSQMPWRRQRYREAALLAAVLVVAAVLRVEQIDRGFWEDEAVEYTLGAARPLWGSFTYQPFPLYHLLSHLSLYLSDAEYVIRIPSLLSGLAGVMALYLVTKRLSDVGAALAAAAALALSTYHISVSTEARFYALAMLSGIAVLWSLDAALRRDSTRNWALFVAAGNFAMMTQLTMLPMVAGMVVGGAMWLIYEQARRSSPELWSRLARLSVASALTLSGVVVAAISGDYDLARFFSLEGDSVEQGMLDDLGNPLGAQEASRLTVAQYGEYLSDYLENPNGFAAACLVLLMIVGVVRLSRKHPVATSLLVAGIVIPPFPFLLVPVAHFHHSRYFCAVLPFLLILLATGLAGLALGARWVANQFTDRARGQGGATRFDRTVAGAAASLPFIGFVVLMAPISANALRGLYNEDFARGLHFEFEHSRTVEFLKEAAVPRDFAATCFPRPDWNYYYREHLALYLNDPVNAEEPFTLWYVGGMANCVNRNAIPTHSRLAATLRPNWLHERTILQYELLAPHIHTLFTAEDLVANDDQGPALRLNVLEDGQRYHLSSGASQALPYRYIEFVLHASGPPQFSLGLSYYDQEERFLRRQVFRMRDIQTQREPHPTGDAPPMTPITQPFALKFVDVSPPLTAFVRAELMVEGDTRRGDVYEVHAIQVRGNWRPSPAGYDTALPPFHQDDNSGWTIQPTSTTSGPTVTPSGEIAIAATDVSPFFRIESPTVPVHNAVSLQLAYSFKGAAHLINPSVTFLDASGVQVERSQLTSEPVYDWWIARNMLVLPNDDGWSRVLATVRVPEDAATVQLVLDADESALESGAATGEVLLLRSPRMWGFD